MAFIFLVVEEVAEEILEEKVEVVEKGTVLTIEEVWKRDIIDKKVYYWKDDISPIAKLFEDFILEGEFRDFLYRCRSLDEIKEVNNHPPSRKKIEEILKRLNFEDEKKKAKKRS